MAINPLTGQPETPEEERARLDAMTHAAPVNDPMAMFAMNVPRTPSAPAGLPMPGAPVPDVIPPPPLATPQDAPAPVFIPPAPAPAPAPPPIIPPAPPPQAPPPAPSLAPPKSAGGGGGGSGLNERQLRGDLSRAQSSLQSAIGQQGDVNIAKAGIEEQNAQAQVDVAKQAADRQAQLEQTTQAEIAKKSSQLEAESEKYRSMGFKDFWSRASIGGKAGTNTGARILGALAVGLGAAGASLTHGPNFAQEMIDKSIDRDYQQQRDTIMKQKDVVEEARFGVQAARQAKADALLSLENWRKSAYEATAAQAKALLAKQGVPEAEANRNVAVSENLMKAQQSKLALEKGIADVMSSKADATLKYAEAARARAQAASDKNPAAKPLTESQAKSSELAGRMKQDNEVLDKLGPMSPEGLKRLRSLTAAEAAFGNSPKAKALAISQGILKTPDQVLNDHDRLVYRTGGRFANSVLRGDSGGAITPQEFLDFNPMYLGTSGDKPQDLASKRAARQQLISGKLAAAGVGAQAATQAGQVAPEIPAQQASVDPAKRARLMELLRQHPDDPRAPEARALLGI